MKTKILRQKFKLAILAVCLFVPNPLHSKPKSKTKSEQSSPNKETKKKKHDPAAPAMEKDPNDPVNQAEATAKEFKACRKKALDQKGEKEIKNALGACNRNFPDAKEYILCKKDKLKKFDDDSVKLREALSLCSQKIAKTPIDYENPVPFQLDPEGLGFAGISMRDTKRPSEIKPQNFNCRDLKAVGGGKGAAQYLLFGNRMQIFAGFSGMSAAKLKKLLSQKGKPKDGLLTIPGYGQITLNEKGAPDLWYFPLSNCFFSARSFASQTTFKGLTHFLLVNRKADEATPYFGIAFYAGDEKVPTPEKLAETVKEKLGSGYEITTNDKGVQFIARDKFVNFDFEGDPSNVCSKKLQHEYIGLVRPVDTNQEMAKYLAIADIKALCRFGDKLAKQLTADK